MASSIRDKLLKTIGLQQKVFTRAQYDQAKRRLRDKDSDGSIGDELVGMNAISRDQLRGLHRAIDYRLGRDDDKGVAKVLVDSGYCEQPAVDEALKRQKEYYAKTGQTLRLADLLVEQGVITKAQSKAALKIHEIEKGSAVSASGNTRSDEPPLLEPSEDEEST